MRNTGSLVYLYRTQDSICICSISTTPLYPPETKKNWLVVSTPFKKYESNWVHLPQIFGMKLPKIFELPPPWNCRHLQVFKSGFSHEKLCKLDLLPSGPSCSTDPPMMFRKFGPSFGPFCWWATDPPIYLFCSQTNPYRLSYKWVTCLKKPYTYRIYMDL